MALVVGLFAFFAASRVNAGCIHCGGSQSCVPGGSTCCCDIHCEVVGGKVVCSCTQKCTDFGCQCLEYGGCESCSSRYEAEAPLRMASLAEPSDSMGFTMTPVIYRQLLEKSALVATVVKNLTTSCNAKKQATVTLLPTARPTAFQGKSSIADGGDFGYSGTLEVKGHTLVVDIVFEPNGSRTQRLAVHVELSQVDMPKYSEKLL